MSRGEWVTLPVAGQVEPRRFRREDIGSYWPRQFPEGEAVMLMRRHTDLVFTIPLPLAEFEALLFGAAEDDAYTRAAVRYAEASIALNDAERKLTEAIDRKQHDTDDLRSDVCSAGYDHDDAEEAFTALYREKHGG